jgi:hypothetical protein
MTYVLTNEQFAQLEAYFELARTAISDEEQYELIVMEPALRDMLIAVRNSQSRS